MTQEQTALVGEPVEVLVNVIVSGSHVAATIDTSTTRIEGYPSTAPTVTTIATGIYKISFSGVTPAPAEGDRLTVKVNGTVTSTSTAWSEYGIPVKILAEERGTDNASTFDSASDQVTVSTNNDKTGYSVTGTVTTANAADVTAIKSVTDLLPDSGALTSLATASALTTVDGVVDSIKTVTDNLPNSGALTDLASASSLSTVDSVVDAIKVKTDQFNFTVANQVDANALTGGGSGGLDAAGVRSAIGLSSANLDTQLGDIPTVAEFEARTLIASAYFDPAADTVSNVSTTGSVTNPVTTSNAADVTAIKAKTDQLTFTTPNSVDATATVSVDESAIADAVLAGIGGNDVTISSPIASDGTTITIVRGDDYNASDARSITWTGDSDDQWPDLTDSTLKFTAKNNLDSMTITPTVTQPTGSQAFRMELTKDDTEILSGRYKYDVQATLSNGRVITLVVGEMIVKQSYSDTP